MSARSHSLLIIWLYNLLLIIGSGLVLPFWLLKCWRRGRINWALLRIGFIKPAWGDIKPGGIWLHALSQGEVNTALPLAKAILAQNERLYFSVATRTGLALAEKVLGKYADCHILVRPLDFPWVVKTWVQKLGPCKFILLESDIWPAWQNALRRADIPCYLVNARISPRTFRMYTKCPPAARWLLADFSLILTQSKADIARLKAIKIKTPMQDAGNLKFDSLPAPLTEEQKADLAKSCHLQGKNVIIAGSTHEGEEIICLQAWQKLKGKPVLLIAPRDTGRAASVKNFYPGAALLSENNPSAQVVVVDSMGVLARLYALGQMAYVGGSLVEQGGHNPLEPAIQAVPVTYGPHMEDFVQMAEELEQAGGSIRISNAQELAVAWQNWLDNPEQALKAGRSGQAFCLVHQGALQKILQKLGMAF